MHTSMRRALAFAVSACLGFGALVAVQATSAAASEPAKPSPTPTVSTANNTLVFETEKPEGHEASSTEKPEQSETPEPSYTPETHPTPEPTEKAPEPGSGGEDDAPIKVPVNFSLGSLFALYDGQPHAVIYTVNSPAGNEIPSTVTYNGSPTPPSAVGQYTVTVTCQTTRFVCTNPSAVLLIAKAPQVINVNPSRNLKVGETEVLSATGGNSGNPVVLSSNSPAICSVTGWRVTGVAAGECHLQLDQAGNSNYLAASPLALSVIVSEVPVVTPPPTSGPTADPSSSSSASPTDTPSAQPDPTTFFSPTPDPTPAPQPSPTPGPSNSQSPSVSPEPSDSHSPAPTSSSTPTTDPTPTPGPSPSATIVSPRAPKLVAGSDLRYYVGQQISVTQLTSNEGDPATSYSISPSLPKGILFDETNGTISGVAKAAAGVATYVVSATNSGGNDTANVRLEVRKNPQKISVGLPSSVTYGDPVIIANPTASSGLGVAYFSTNPSVISINSQGNFVIQSVGTTYISFSQPGDGTYDAAPDLTVSITVKPRVINLSGVTVTVDKNGNVTFTGGNLDGILPGDQVGFSGAGVSGSYSNSTLSQAGRFTLNGRDASNYVLNQPNEYDIKVENSNSSTSQTPWAPLTSTPVESQPKNGHATVGGFDVAVVLRANTSRNGLEFLAPGWQLGLGATDAGGKQVDLAADGTLRVQRDHTFVASGAGFAPNSNVKLFIFSSALDLGVVSTDSRGSFNAAEAVPDSLEIGLHTLQVVGYSPTGQILTGEIPVTLVESASVPVPTVQKYTNILYFNPGTKGILKRSTSQLRKLAALLGTGLKNPQLTLTAYNSRKDIHPTNDLAVSRLRSVALYLRSKIASTSITRNIGSTRRNHWGYIRFTVTYTK